MVIIPHQERIFYTVCRFPFCKQIDSFPYCAGFSESEVNDMAKNSKQTSKAVASKASRILKDRRYGKDSKSVAGSALTQTRPGKK